MIYPYRELTNHKQGSRVLWGGGGGGNLLQSWVNLTIGCAVIILEMRVESCSQFLNWAKTFMFVRAFDRSDGGVNEGYRSQCSSSMN